MFGNYKLADLKNAPLSILVFLSLSGNRAVTVTDLAVETGFSEKPIRKGLKTLRDLGLITEPRKNRYQLTGKEYQLPLSWGERILEAGDSPEITGVLTGNTGISPELERRVMLLEQAVFGEKSEIVSGNAGETPEISGDFPLIESDKEESIEIVESPREEWSGNTPGKLGVFPVDGRNSRNVAVTGQWIEQERKGETPGKTGETPVDGRNSRNAAVTGQWVEKESAGETPEKTGEIPGITGDIPEGINPLINNLNINKVSKYVDNKDTYLLNGMSKEVKEINPGGSGQLPVASVQESGVSNQDEMNWKSALAQMKGSMDRQTFCSTLKDAELIGVVDGHFTVAVKNGFIRDICDQRLRVCLEKILTVMCGRDVSVSFVVGQGAGTIPQAVQSPVEWREHFRNVAAVVEAAEKSEWETTHLPESVDPVENVLVGICNEYLDEPTGIVYSLDELSELIGIHADPRVLRYILPRAKRFENTKKICARGFAENKRRLLAKYGIINDNFCRDDNVSLELISEVCQEVCDGTEEGKKTACWRIGKLAVGDFEE